MKKSILPMSLGVLLSQSVLAADYIVDFGVIADLEDLRPLVDLCTDFGALERYRGIVESASNLETLRDLLENLGSTKFSGCPENVAETGITQVPE